MAKNKSKVWSWLIPLIVVIVIIGLIVGFSHKQEKEETIKVGAILPMTGDRAYFGQSHVRGANIAIEEINSKGGIDGKKLELIVEDDQGKPTEAVTAFNRLSSDVDIFIVGIVDDAQALAPLAEEKKKILIGMVVTPLGNECKYCFKDYYDNNFQANTLARAALKDNNITSIAFIGLNAPGLNEMYEAFKEEYERGGGKITSFHKVGFRETDYKTILIKIKQENPNGIFIWVYPHMTINFFKQLTELGMENKRVIGVQLQEPKVTNEVQDILNATRAISSWFSVETNSSAFISYKEKFEEKYGKDSFAPVSTYTYDEIYVIAKALEKCENKDKLRDTDCIRKEMLNISMMGVAGPLKFDENGNAIRGSYIEKYEDGRWIYFYKSVPKKLLK